MKRIFVLSGVVYLLFVGYVSVPSIHFFDFVSVIPARAYAANEFVDTDISKYVADAQNNKAHGKAKGQESSYTGIFQSGKKNGYGKTVWSNGASYEGMHKNGNLLVTAFFYLCKGRVCAFTAHFCKRNRSAGHKKRPHHQHETA